MISFQRVQYGQRGKESNFTVEKADKHYFSQVIKFDIYPWYSDENGTLPLWSSSLKLIIPA